MDIPLNALDDQLDFSLQILSSVAASGGMLKYGRQTDLSSASVGFHFEVA